MSELNMLEALKQTAIASKQYGDTTCGCAIKGTASGIIVALDDIAPLEHNIKITTKSKNLFDVNKIPSLDTGYGVTGTNNGNGSITIKGYAYNTGILLKDLAPALKVGDTAILTAAYDNEPSYKAVLLSKVKEGWNYGKTKVITEDMLNSAVYLYGSKQYTEDDPSTIVTLRNIQIELGTTATAYTPYVADDAEVTLTACGKNILKYPFVNTTKTHSGITFTDNGDGTITANGTCTPAEGVPYGEFMIYRGSLDADNVTFTLSGCPSGGSASTYHLVDSSSGFRDIGSGTKFAKNLKNIDIRIRIYPGTTVNNLVFKPQLIISNSSTIPAFEKYIEYAQITTSLLQPIVLSNMTQNMTFFTDKSGIVIEMDYNKDSNKVIEKLIQAIISLGGSI